MHNVCPGEIYIYSCNYTNIVTYIIFLTVFIVKRIYEIYMEKDFIMIVMVHIMLYDCVVIVFTCFYIRNRN